MREQHPWGLRRVLYLLSSTVLGVGVAWALLASVPALRRWPMLALTACLFLTYLPADIHALGGWRVRLKWLAFGLNAVALDLVFAWQWRMIASFSGNPGTRPPLPPPPVPAIVAIVMAFVVAMVSVACDLHQRSEAPNGGRETESLHDPLS